MPAENLHVTLAFLGEQSEADLEQLHQELLTLSFDPLLLKIQGLEARGGKQPGLLWARIAPDATLTALHKAIRGKLRLCGLELPRERFRPHITLARFPRPQRRGDGEEILSFLRAEGGYASRAFPCDRFALFRSELGADGASYEELAGYPFCRQPPLKGVK